MSNKIEFRTFKTEVRASADKPMISGTAAVYNVTTDLGGGYREKINPAAFNRALAEKQDVRCLFNHNADHVLGRTKTGTLRLTNGNSGLDFDCDINEADPQAMSTRAKVGRGDVDQCSFAFVCKADKVIYNDDGSMERELMDVDLMDVSPVTYPAYESTSCEARSVEEARKAVEAARPRTVKELTKDELETLRLRVKVAFRETDPGTPEECECRCQECRDGMCSMCSDPKCDDMQCHDAYCRKFYSQSVEFRKVKYLVTESDGTTHLPVTGEDGKPNHHLMGAAWAALHGGYRGNKYEGPNKSEAIKKLKAMYKEEGMELPSEK